MNWLALAVLRIYPSAWRIRYEEEVRHLLAANPPGAFDVFGLARNAVSEWSAEYSDPVANPGMAAVVRRAFGWLGIVSAIQFIGVASGQLLQGFLGIGPRWAGLVASSIVFALCLRGMATGLTWRRQDGPFRPLGRLELRFWWSALVLAVVAGHWTDNAMIQMWPMACASILLGLSERAWHLAKARRLWIDARNDHLEKIRDYMHVARLVPNGLSTNEELEDLAREVARLGERGRDAAAAYRAAGLRRLPPSLGLN